MAAAGAAHDLGQLSVGAKRLFAAPKKSGVARFEAQDGGIRRHIGPGLIDNAYHPQRNANFADV